MADQNNPQATIQYKQAAGPSRAGYDAAQKEKQQKFKKDFAIESNVHSTRLRQEKQEEQWEAKRKKDAEREDARKAPPARRRGNPSGRALPAQRPPAFRQSDFLPNFSGGGSPFGGGGHYPGGGMGLPDINPMDMHLPQFEMGPDAPPYRKKGKGKKKRGGEGMFAGGFDPNYIPPQLRQFF